ncbi:ABC-type transport auxiliary lipoprotein family protein [Coraliomargarita sp. SDUM461004]|uniref:ABC-type transport auxiliary lipoprotein family protein n=1 Tax=Thalassobacterium sedimentorum TaxID=3041258 RepID=A0ABU1AGL9_9BACT|nr:ABC-type transport auxiliary lipoprotein family protein [Coraliomargarita sp. SDUM461004]MDQ8193837.1 ABC-type transport auxiliary lipoprotein family protein [Coraliomargarita sp. SDUM461004]
MKISLLISLTLAILLTGCVNLKPKPDRTQVFTLAANVDAVADIAGKPECYVGRVELPGFLEGPRIYYRSTHGELSSVAGARWAEDLRDALPRAIAMHLQATSLAHVRAYYPWANTASEAATISVQFERLSANAGGQIEVIAQWQIEQLDGSRVQGRFMAPGLMWDQHDVSEYVANLDAALAQLSQEIAEKL